MYILQILASLVALSGALLDVNTLPVNIKNPSRSKYTHCLMPCILFVMQQTLKGISRKSFGMGYSAS